jgi:hypothetical protein
MRDIRASSIGRVACADYSRNTLISPYQTHQPLLFACARRSFGEVIELGCGLHSTPQLAAICPNFKSYETDRKWASCIKGLVKSVTYVESYDDVPVKHYAMVFVDGAPEERRKVDLERFYDSRLVVVHDTDRQYSGMYGMEEALALYPYRFDYKWMSPNTSVVSWSKEAIEEIKSVF